MPPNISCCTIEAAKTTGYVGGQFYNSGSDAFTSTTNVCDNAQHLLVMTRIGTAVKIYVDGSAVGAGATSSKNITGDDLLIGYASVGSTYDYIGQALIDDIFVMSRGLSASEVTGLYNWTLTPFSGGIIII